MEQEYLNPYDDSRVFDDETLVSYSLERRAWVVCKDGFELILRDTMLPQPEEVLEFIKSRGTPGGQDALSGSHTLNTVLAAIFPEKTPVFYAKVRKFMSEALIGAIETPQGALPTYDLAHLTMLFADIEPSIKKTTDLLRALVAGCCAYKAAYFLTIPPTRFDYEEEEPDGSEAL